MPTFVNSAGKHHENGRSNSQCLTCTEAYRTSFLCFRASLISGTGPGARTEHGDASANQPSCGELFIHLCALGISVSFLIAFLQASNDERDEHDGCVDVIGLHGYIYGLGWCWVIQIDRRAPMAHLKRQGLVSFYLNHRHADAMPPPRSRRPLDSNGSDGVVP